MIQLRISALVKNFALFGLILLLGYGLSVQYVGAQQPKSGGTIKVGVPAIPKQLDPAKQRGGEEYILSYWMFDALTFLDRDMFTVKPELATKWEASKDLKTWTFYLRKGVKFHHGKEMTSEDVIASYERIMDPATGSPIRVNFLIVEKLEAVDKYTVRFYLKIPYAEMPHILAERQARIIAKDKIDTLSTHPIGTGPFKFKEFIMGDHGTFVKNQDYWDKGLPYLNEITLKMIPETAVAMTSLETGELDLYWMVPLEAIDELKTKKGIIVDEVPTSTWDTAVMANNQPPFNDVRVRQAFFYSTNKDELVKACLFGHGAPTHSPIPPGHPMFNKSLGFLKQDFDKAKKLLAEAGYPNGLEIKLFIPEGRPTRERLGIALKDMVKPAGINIDLQRMPWDKFLADIEGKAIFHTDGFFSRPTIDTSIYPWFYSKGSWNSYSFRWGNPRVDEILDKARGTANEKDRKTLYDEFQKILRDEGPGIIPFIQYHATAYKPYVKNFNSHPMMMVDLRKTWLSK